jgi:pyrroloquinoline quinone biosynthesis protein B
VASAASNDVASPSTIRKARPQRQAFGHYLDFASEIYEEHLDRIALVGAVTAPVRVEITTLFKLIELGLGHRNRPPKETALAALAMPGLRWFPCDVPGPARDWNTRGVYGDLFLTRISPLAFPPQGGRGMLRIIVLGAGAGGGFPQWNCNCANCQRARAGDPLARPATQSSLAISGDGGASWYLLNASPDLRQQIAQTPQLHPRKRGRDSPISGVILTNADVDHVAGLLTMREAQPIGIYGMPRVLEAVRGNAIFKVLDSKLVSWRPLVMDQMTEISGPTAVPSGLSARAFPVPSKVALWREDPQMKDFGSTAEDTVGLELMAKNGKHFFYVPGCASMQTDLAERLRGVELVFFDGTTYTDDEMIALGLGSKTASRMGHMSVSGVGGSVASFKPLRVARKIFIHINNSNPILVADSPERKAVEAAGWEVGTDGLEVVL